MRTSGAPELGEVKGELAAIAGALQRIAHALEEIARQGNPDFSALDERRGFIQ